MKRSKRRASRYTPPKNSGLRTATVHGVVELAGDIESLKQATHDQLIQDLGPRRRTAVRWVVTTGDHALEFLIMERGTTVSEDYDREALHAQAAAMIENGGTLVVALCDYQPAKDQT